MDLIVYFIARDFAKDFPQFVDHFEGDKPIFSEVGSILFTFRVVYVVTACFSKLLKSGDCL